MALYMKHVLRVYLRFQ